MKKNVIQLDAIDYNICFTKLWKAFLIPAYMLLLLIRTTIPLILNRYKNTDIWI